MATVQDAAVLVPIYRQGDGALWIVLVRRAEGGVHGGEIAFPGGRREAADRSLRDTALREAHEEIGLAAEEVEVLEQLPIVRTRSTGFRITPFLARIRRPAAWRPTEREIAEVVEVRLSDLARPAAHAGAGGEPPDPSGAAIGPYFRVGPHRLWGATYRILRPLIPRLTAGDRGI